MAGRRVSVEPRHAPLYLCFHLALSMAHLFIPTLPFPDEDVAQIKAVGINTSFRAMPPAMGAAGGQGRDAFTDTGISGGAGLVNERELEVRTGGGCRGAGGRSPCWDIVPCASFQCLPAVPRRTQRRSFASSISALVQK